MALALTPGAALAQEGFPLFPPPPAPPALDAPQPLLLSCDGNGVLTFRPGVPARGFMCQLTNNTPEPLGFFWTLEGPPGSSLGPPAGGPLFVPEFGTAAFPPMGVFSAIPGESPGEMNGVLRVSAFEPFSVELFGPPALEMEGSEGMAPEVAAVQTAPAEQAQPTPVYGLEMAITLLMAPPAPTAIPTVVATMVPTPAPTAAATPAPPSASGGGIAIDVVHGVGSSTLIVKGKGFPPGREIVIRTTGPGVTDREVRATAGPDGSVDAKVGITRYGIYEVDAGGVKGTFEVK